MSYLSKRMHKRAKSGLSGFATDIVNSMSWLISGSTPETAQNAACLAAANAQSSSMLAKATDLSKNWNPTGLYSLEQIQSIVQNTMAMLLAAANTVDHAIAEAPDGADDALKLKRAAIQRKMSTEGLVFTTAIGNAMKAGIGVIDAPGLKAWVVNSMTVAADGITGAYYVSCQTPWWVGALRAFMAAFDKVWGVAKQVAGVAVELGAQVLKIPDTIGQIWTMAKWGSIALLAFWAYENAPRIAKGM